jgi:hypothetical protein
MENKWGTSKVCSDPAQKDPVPHSNKEFFPGSVVVHRVIGGEIRSFSLPRLWNIFPIRSSSFVPVQGHESDEDDRLFVQEIRRWDLHPRRPLGRGHGRREDRLDAVRHLACAYPWCHQVLAYA